MFRCFPKMWLLKLSNFYLKVMAIDMLKCLEEKKLFWMGRFICICELQLVHRFFYDDVEIPAIGGYDLLRAAHIMIDTQSSEVWSKHPDVAHQASYLKNIFVTVPSQPIPNGIISSHTVDNARIPCFADDTSYVQKDIPLTAPGVPTHRLCPGGCAVDYH